LEEAEVGFLKRMKNSQVEEGSEYFIDIDEKLDFKYRSISTGLDSRVTSARKGANNYSSNKTTNSIVKI
jgi:hypothetical protein